MVNIFFAQFGRKINKKKSYMQIFNYYFTIFN